MFRLIKCLLETLTVEFTKEKMAVLKIRLFSKQWTLPLVQIKNLVNSVCGELRSKSQTRRAFAPPDGLGPGPPPHTQVCTCVKASKSLVEVTEQSSQQEGSGPRPPGGGSSTHRRSPDKPAGRTPCGSLVPLQSYSPFMRRKSDWKIKLMHSRTHRFIKSSLERKTAGWEWSK